MRYFGEAAIPTHTPLAEVERADLQPHELSLQTMEAFLPEQDIVQIMLDEIDARDRSSPP
jgi:hypothetical protein